MIVSVNEEAMIKFVAEEFFASAVNRQVVGPGQSGSGVGDDKYRKSPREAKAG
jgi:hypothetical protein